MLITRLTRHKSLINHNYKMTLKQIQQKQIKHKIKQIKTTQGLQ